MNSLTHPMLDVYLLGFSTALALAAGLFFLRFWRSTRDGLFLAFSIFFFVQGGTHALVLDFEHPNEGSVWLFLLRLLSVLGVLGTILWKNRSGSGGRRRGGDRTRPADRTGV